MKMRSLLMLAACFVAVPSPVMADVEKILQQCKIAITAPSEIDKNPILAGIDIGFCFGYVRGISDYVTGTAPMSKKEMEVFKSCRPENVDNKQLARIVVNFLESNPQYHHFSITTLIALALKDAFPCK